MLKRSLFMITLFTAQIANAGEQYLDGTGYAVSGYDVVSYFGMEQAAVGVPQAPGIPGKLEFVTEHNDAKFAFSSEENMNLFMADPERYAPQYDGHCALGVAHNNKVPGNPNDWRVVDAKLYVIIEQNAFLYWEKDIDGNIVAGDKNWPALEPKPASTTDTPGFASKAPIH